jgi:hypothetical protein
VLSKKNVARIYVLTAAFMNTELAWDIKHSSNDDESSINITCFVYQLAWVSYSRRSQSLLSLSEKTEVNPYMFKNFTLKQAMKAKKGRRALRLL